MWVASRARGAGMSRSDKLQCVLLLVLVTIPVSIPRHVLGDGHLQATAFGGWPAVGFSVALFIVARRELRWWAFGLQLLTMSIALSHSYGVSLLLGVAGALSAILPALFCAHMLRADGGRLRLDPVGNARSHTGTAAFPGFCGLGAAAAVAVGLAPTDAPISALMSFLAALTAQLVVLPLVVRSSDRRAAAGRFELPCQRLLMLII